MKEIRAMNCAQIRKKLAAEQKILNAQQIVLTGGGGGGKVSEMNTIHFLNIRER